MSIDENIATKRMTRTAESTLITIGEALREQREYRGEDIYEIADYLRIRPSYLMGLENGDIQAIPARPYAFGFLRTYGSYLGFDGEELVRRFKRALSEPESQESGSRRTHDEPAPPRRTASASLTWTTAAVMLVAGICGGWWVMYEGDAALEAVRAVPATIGKTVAGFLQPDKWTLADNEPVRASAPEDTRRAEAPERPALTDTASLRETAAERPLEALSSTPDRPAPEDKLSATDAASPLKSLETPGSIASVAPRASSDGEPQSSPSDSTEGLEALVAPATASHEAPGRPPALGEAAPTERGVSGNLDIASAEPILPTERGSAAAATVPLPTSLESGRVILFAREESWIQVRSRDRSFVRTRTLEAGETFVLPDRIGLALWTGNAGGLEVVVDGRNLGGLGASGEVVRDVSMAPESLLNLLNP